ncbi:MAG: hypothetical protein LBI72_05300 [Flavobacteriaceae bacterium]|jgi:ribonuclease HI|nr:hypothetical protein [Flavobacteriaceae bacterium]
MKYKIDLYTRVKIDVNSDAKAYANILCLEERCKSFVEGFVENSQSRISLMGIVKGLEQLKEAAEVTIYTTSKYALNTYEKGWIAKWRANHWLKKDGEHPLNLDLWKRFAIQMDRHQLQFCYVSNYTAYKQLVQCKALGADVLSKGELHVDEVYRTYLEELNLHLMLETEETESDANKEVVVKDDLQLIGDKEREYNNEPHFDALEAIDDEVNDHDEEAVEESLANSRPTVLRKMPREIKLLVAIRNELNRYFESQKELQILRSTDLYDLIKKNKGLRERFPFPVLFNRFLRRQHQEGILKQIIPNCSIDTFNEDFYQWCFHR